MDDTRARSAARQAGLLAASALACGVMAAFPAVAPSDGGWGAVRRWEHVLAVRTSNEVPGAIGRVERAAFQAGGAVLEQIRSDYTGDASDYRLLVRTGSRDSIKAVVREVGRQVGVLGVAVVQLPETPTVPGGPSFMTSYTAGYSSDSPPPGVIVHHEIPPVADKRDLLEITDVPVGPGVPNPADIGGFTMNVSQIFKNWKEGAWRKREERMKNGYLPILPSEGEPEDAAGATPSEP